MKNRKKGEGTTTELEAAVLGLIWQGGPCTRYAVRQAFLESRAPRWSGSAGAIYPLVARLETRGLLRSTPGSRGHRPQRDYRITRSGLAALKRWLRAPIGAGDATLIHDPLRTRLLFLSALPRDEAMAVIANAVDALNPALRQARSDCRNLPADEDFAAHFAARNALLVTRARLQWLTEVHARLATSRSPASAP